MTRKQKRRLLADAGSYVALMVVSFLCVLPFIWMIATALKPEGLVRKSPPTFYSGIITLDNFSRLITENSFGTFIKNSLVISVIVTFFVLIVTLLSGYAFSRYGHTKVVRRTRISMMLSQMVPGVLLLIPLYRTIQALGLLNTHFSLVIAYITFTISFCTFMVSGAYDMIPVELEQAAEVDGCGRLRTVIVILMPVMIPSIISTGIYAFIQSWSEFMFSYVLVSGDEMRTVTPAIMLFKGQYQVDWGAIMAASVMAVLPPLIIFFLLQKYYISGMLQGSVKG